MNGGVAIRWGPTMDPVGSDFQVLCHFSSAVNFYVFQMFMDWRLKTGVCCWVVFVQCTRGLIKDTADRDEPLGAFASDAGSSGRGWRQFQSWRCRRWCLDRKLLSDDPADL